MGYTYLSSSQLDASARLLGLTSFGLSSNLSLSSHLATAYRVVLPQYTATLVTLEVSKPARADGRKLAIAARARAEEETMFNELVEWKTEVCKD